MLAFKAGFELQIKYPRLVFSMPVLNTMKVITIEYYWVQNVHSVYTNHTLSIF